MKKISRNNFIKQSLAAGALLSFPVLGPDLFSQTNRRIAGIDAELLNKLVAANDRQVAALLQTDLEQSRFSRRTGYDFAALAAAFCAVDSRYHQSPEVIGALQKLAQLLLRMQSDDGTVDIGNLESPPDTAFLLEPVCAAALLLAKKDAAGLQGVNSSIKKFILRAGDALATGGVHTPNHRWVVSAALARVNALYPNPRYIGRINDWLGEGVFIDGDGNFPERSRNYAIVEDDSLLTIGRLLGKPALFKPVRKNLDTTYYYLEPNGDLAVNDSRRQDQYASKTIVNYYHAYRYLAIRDNNSAFAAMAKAIEGMRGFEEEILNRSFYHFLEEPLLQQVLPQPAPPPPSFERFFDHANLLRIRRGDTTITLFGGIDWPLIIASGRSCSPDFFSYRKGEAILQYMRLSTSFFGTGYFYSQGISKTSNSYRLHKKLSVPYYQPLPKNLRNNAGDYKLSPSIDDRFWNKMDFSHRPVSNVKTLDTSIAFTEKNGRCELAFTVEGQHGVLLTIELCFQEGGRLSGVSEAGNQNYFLEQGMGEYSQGNSVIRFGPGATKQKTIANLEGERYSTHFGTLRTAGMHVFLTGVTPFRHTLIFS